MISLQPSSVQDFSHEDSYKGSGITGIVGGMLLAKGAACAFGAGIIMCLLVYGRNFFRGDSTPSLFTEEQTLQPAEKATSC